MTEVDLNRQAHVLAQAAKTAADLCNYLAGELPDHPDAMHPDTAESIHNAARELREGLDLATGAYRRVADAEKQQAPALQPQAAPAPEPQPQAATPAAMWHQQTGQGMSIPRPTWENQNQQAPDPQLKPQQETETESPTTAYAWR